VKKTFAFLILILFSICLIACSNNQDKVLSHPGMDYYVAGRMIGSYDTSGPLMEPTMISDPRIEEISNKLSNAKYLYIAEVHFPFFSSRDFHFYEVDNISTEFDASLTIKIIRYSKENPDQRDMVFPSNASHKLHNLTPDMLVVPKFTILDEPYENVTLFSPVAKTPGSYYVVFAELRNGQKAMGLIPVSTPFDPLMVNLSTPYFITTRANIFKQNSSYEMEAVRLSDPRISSIRSQLDQARFVYVLSIYLSGEQSLSLITYTINQEQQSFYDTLSLRVLKPYSYYPTRKAWTGPNQSSGSIENLTPSTLYMPPYRSTNPDGAGDFNSPPVAYEPGQYLAVFVEYWNGSSSLGLISKKDLDMPLSNVDYEYYLMSIETHWNAKKNIKFNAIFLSDPRVASIRHQLDGVSALYVAEANFSSISSGWSHSYKINGVTTAFDGSVLFKVAVTYFGFPDRTKCIVPSTDSGEVINLTSDTLYIPTYQDGDFDGTGNKNSNLAVFQPGTYYIIYAEYADASRAIGLIPKS
jgi:hypothetical protein